MIFIKQYSILKTFWFIKPVTDIIGRSLSWLGSRIFTLDNVSSHHRAKWIDIMLSYYILLQTNKFKISLYVINDGTNFRKASVYFHCFIDCDWLLILMASLSKKELNYSHEHKWHCLFATNLTKRGSRGAARAAKSLRWSV